MNTALRQLYFGDGQFYELSPDDDDFQFDFDDSLFDAAAREILDNGGYTPDYLTTPTGSALINETNRAFTDAISKGLGEQPDPAVAAALRENAFIFSGFKTHAELEQVAQLITDENGNIRPLNEFLNDVKQLNQDYNHRYLRTEYNQAVQAAQMASKWADFERDKEFINLQYRTANDERVRASHRVLHGVTLPVDDKFWEQYTPPNGWGCRCTVVAVPKDDPDFPVRDAQGSTINGKEVFPTPAYEIFKTNTAKAKKVFPDKHPYLPKGCGNCPLNNNKSLTRYPVSKKGDCTHCKIREKYFEWKGKTVAQKIKESAFAVIPPNGREYHLPNLVSGKTVVTRSNVTNLIDHIPVAYKKYVLMLLSNLEKLTLVKPYGEKKYETKKSRAYVYFNYYELTVDGKTLFVTMGVTKEGEEKLYAVQDKIKKSD